MNSKLVASRVKFREIENIYKKKKKVVDQGDSAGDIIIMLEECEIPFEERSKSPNKEFLKKISKSKFDIFCYIGSKYYFVSEKREGEISE